MKGADMELDGIASLLEEIRDELREINRKCDDLSELNRVNKQSFAEEVLESLWKIEASVNHK
jgi:hypothetical protein